MKNEFLFAQALNIQEPLYIEKIDFKKDDGELHIYINFRKGSTFKCSVCNKDGMPVHDTEKKTWRHLDFFQYKAYIHFRRPRVTCPEHNTHIIKVPWGGTGSGFTLLMEAMIMELARHMPVSEIAKKIGEYDTKVWRVINRNINNARATENFTDVKSVGVDETASKKGHKYITIFVDMDKNKVLFATEGKDSSTLKRFNEDLVQHSGIPLNITEFSADMSRAFAKGIDEHFKSAFITFDKFHVVKIINEAVDKTRREEQKENAILKNSRYIWLKNPSNLSDKQSESLENLSKLNLKTARAYRIKLSLQEIYNECTNVEEAEERLNKWISWASRSRLKSMKEAAKTIKQHFTGILRYFHTRLTNGILEGINGIVQAARARARGFRNTKNFIAMVYLLGSKLTFNYEL